jgi:hypothetical protein
MSKLTISQAVEAYLRYEGRVESPLPMREFFAEFDPETLQPSADQPLAYLLDQRRNHKKKTRKMLEVEEKFSEPLEVILTRLYVDEQLPLVKTGKVMGVSNIAVKKWLQQYDIHVRTMKEQWLIRTGGTKPDDGVLR